MKLSDRLHNYAVAKDAGYSTTDISWDVFALQAGELETTVHKLEAVVDAAEHFAAAGYAEPQMDWRQPLLDALADLET